MGFRETYFPKEPPDDLMHCKELMHKTRKVYNLVFVFNVALVAIPFVLYFFMLFLSLGLLGWYYLDEVWYRPLLFGMAMLACYKKKELFCYLCPIAAALLVGMQVEQVPLGALLRVSTFSGYLVVFPLCIWAIRTEKMLAAAEGYPYFTARVTAEEKVATLTQKKQAATAEYRSAPSLYSHAAQQSHMDDLIVPPAPEHTTKINLSKEGLSDDKPEA